MSRFFVQLIKRVAEKEDVFTECLAAALREDPQLAHGFLVTLCGERLDNLDILTANTKMLYERQIFRTVTTLTSKSGRSPDESVIASTSRSRSLCERSSVRRPR
jgi:hypothetical protein